MEDTSKARPDQKKDSEFGHLFLTIVGILIVSFLLGAYVSGSWALLVLICGFGFLFFRASDWAENLSHLLGILLTLPILLGLVVLLLSPYVFDWGFIDGEITEYPIMPCSECKTGKMTLGTRTFKPSVRQQKVAEVGVIPIEEYIKCVVIDRENWDCTYNDGSGKFGFSKGEFWCDDPKTEEWGWRYVTRPVWLYYKWFN